MADRCLEAQFGNGNRADDFFVIYIDDTSETWMLFLENSRCVGTMAA